MLKRWFDNRLFCNKNISTIYECIGIVTKESTKPSFRSVSLYSITNLFGGCKSNFTDSILRKKKENNTIWMVPFSFVINILKLFMKLQCIKPAYTVNFLRPFARRLLIILRPFLVAIRALNPWVDFLGLLWGWYVLFIDISLYNFKSAIL